MTPKEREVMELALEALEELNNTNSYWWQEVDEQTIKKIDPAITAIKAALEAHKVLMSLQDGAQQSPQRSEDTRRAWVGLTKKDMDWLHENTPCIEGNYGYRFIKAIEAKLKEKNTK